MLRIKHPTLPSDRRSARENQPRHGLMIRSGACPEQTGRLADMLTASLFPYDCLPLEWLPDIHANDDIRSSGRSLAGASAADWSSLPTAGPAPRARADAAHVSQRPASSPAQRHQWHQGQTCNPTRTPLSVSKVSEEMCSIQRQAYGDCLLSSKPPLGDLKNGFDPSSPRKAYCT